jgi:tetratricopeptide (TPR) repeat protein
VESEAASLVERFPARPDAAALMVRLHRRFGSPDDAQAWCQRCIELDPSYVFAHVQMGMMARKRGDEVQGAEHFRKAVELQPNSESLRVDLAETLMALNRWDEAARVAQEGLEQQPKSAPLLALLGEVRLGQKQYEKARAALEAAVELGPDLMNAYYGLGTACAKLNDRAKADQYLEKFKALHAADEQKHRNRLKTYDDNETVREGVAEVQTAIGRVYLEAGDPASAESHFVKALQLHPTGTDCREVLAWLYEEQGRTEEALSVWRELCQRSPRDLTGQVSLGMLCARLKRYDEAERAFRTAIELTPRRPEPYAALLNVFLEANRSLPEAKTTALRIVDLEPSAPNYFLLATACQRSGDAAAARSAIEHAAELDPENARLQELLRGSPGRGDDQSLPR